MTTSREHKMPSIIKIITFSAAALIPSPYTIGVECFQFHRSNSIYSINHVNLERKRKKHPWGGYMHRVKAQNAMKLVPEDNQSIDHNQLSVSGVSYKAVLSGLKELYPPKELDKRNAISRKDGYWYYIKKGEENPQSLTYGEFDFLFFSELLDRAHHHYFNETETVQTNGWDGKVFADIGSGTGRLVIGAAALHPGFSKCKGLEILSGIHEESLDTLNKCKKYKEQCISDRAGAQAEEQNVHREMEKSDMQPLTSKMTDNGEKDNEREVEKNAVEPLTPEMIEMQKALQQITAEEWQDMMGDNAFDDYVDDDVFVENFKDETGVGYTNIVDDDVEGEDEDLIEQAVDEKTSEYVNARSVPYEIHPEFSIPSEDDLITVYSANEEEAIIEHKFNSFGEFEGLSTEEWQSIYGNDTMNKEGSAIGSVEIEEDVQVGTKENHKKDRSGEHVLRSPSDSSFVSLDTNENSDLPLAPIEFLNGSFEDPYICIGDVDVAFVFSTCMTEKLMGSLSRAFGRQCKPGTIIITTDFKLHLEGSIDPDEDDPNLPFGKFKFEVLEKVDGFCWLVGGKSTAYIHRVVQSLWVDEDGGRKEKPRLSKEEQAAKIVKAMQGNVLTNITTIELRSMKNALVFHYPELIRTYSER